MTVGSQASGHGSKHPAKIIANIFISFIGAGILGLPYAFKEAGVMEGIIVMIAVSFLSIKAMMLLVECKYRILRPARRGDLVKLTLLPEEELLNNNDDDDNLDLESKSNSRRISPGQDITYGDIGQRALGSIGKTVIDVTILISQIGFSCAYIIFISENLFNLFPWFQLRSFVLLTLVPFFMLTLIRHLDHLAMFSLLAQTSNLLAFAVVFWFDFEHWHVVHFHPKEYSLKGFPFYFCVAIYCFEGAGMILSLETSLVKEVRHKFPKYFIGTMVFITGLYIVFGVSGYLSYGPETREIITLNLPHVDGIDFPSAVKVCLCISLFFAYPVMMFPVTQLIEARWMRHGTQLQGNLLRFLLVAITVLIALVVPNFATLMGLIGATCCTMLAFIFPPWCHYRIAKGSLTRSQVCFDFFLILLGIVGMGIGLWDFTVRMFGHTPRWVGSLNKTDI